ncbi:MAG TPA: M36 family metallopeptidase [Blastocatellia bacterium]|nr:M36 family metallopeptidase [Blastocatellia bacterium]
MHRYRTLAKFAMVLLSAAIALSGSTPSLKVQAASDSTATKAGTGFEMYWRPAPDYDFNLARGLGNLRKATADQLAAIGNLKAAANAPSMTVRWNDFGGSPDVLMDFASQAYSGTPEEAARSFLAANATIFGIGSLNDLQLFSQREALGGYLLRFQQTFNGIPVKDGGVGLVMNGNKQVIMASGPYFRDVNVNTTPALSADQARAAADADLAKYFVSLPAEAMSLLQPALDNLAQQLAAVQNLQPALGIYPTADGYKLVWKVAKFSTNPFGLYLISVDAQTGEIVSRQDYANFQQAPLPFTADIYPKYPTITQELKDQGIISDCNGTPCGQERVTLRKFDQTNVTTGLNGTLTGTHALVNNALATKLPFAQAAKGTWHFRVDDPTNFEARTNEIDQRAEPAEHQDEINAFFFVTYLLEYVDYLHVAGDRQNFGQGDFPDDYPNKTVPLPATVHIPNIYLALNAINGQLPNVSDPAFVDKALGLDNAVAFNVTGLIQSLTGVKSPIVANPTVYGHGYYFNDLALEGTVPYHEGMHAITSPIAGLEGEPEGGALNEGQADMWAFTITNNPSLGDYVVNAFKLRQLYRDRGRNPDSIAYIRSARSTLKYSDIGTLVSGGVAQFEEHYDGEIYMSTMWDIREMLNRVYPNTTNYKRPAPKDGTASKVITQGTEIFERDFLGSMYVLGTTAPDTFVKARDAMLVADQMLYSSNTTDPAAPGRHRALIEQIFAAHEMGVNAREVTGGVATISTQVTPFTGNQPAPAVPTYIRTAPASTRSVTVSWQGVSGAVAYEVLKRKLGFENKREPNGIRNYNDGDASTTGYRHVAFVSSNLTSYEDKGAVHEIFAPEGLSNLFDHEYVVRAIGVNASGQLGFSNLSGSSRPLTKEQNVTKAVDTAIANVSFANGVFAFDQTLTNARGANSSDKTIYTPIAFRIEKISDPTVTVRNPDQTNPVPTFFYNQILPLGATSGPRRLEFNDPLAKLFTFDAKVLGQVFTGSTTGSGSQPGDGTSNPPTPVTYSVFRQEFNGTLPLGDPTGITTGGGLLKEDYYADPNFKGVTWTEVEVVTKPDAQYLDLSLSSMTAVDMDLELRAADGTLITRSAGSTASEHIQAQVQPNTRYIVRVVGWVNVAADYKIVSDQWLPQGSPNANAGTVTPSGSGSTGGGTTVTGVVEQLLRFTVNPLTRTVTVQLLQ